MSQCRGELGGGEFVMGRNKALKILTYSSCMRQTLFVRFSNLQFALATENYVKYFPTNN